MRTSLQLAAIVGSLVLATLAFTNHAGSGPPPTPVDRAPYLRQLDDDDAVAARIDRDYARRQDDANFRILMAGATGLLFAGTFGARLWDRRAAKPAGPAGS